MHRNIMYSSDYDAAALFTDPATGDFTMKKELNCGDPRWFKQD